MSFFNQETHSSENLPATNIFIAFKTKGGELNAFNALYNPPVFLEPPAPGSLRLPKMNLIFNQRRFFSQYSVKNNNMHPEVAFRFKFICMVCCFGPNLLRIMDISTACCITTCIRAALLLLFQMESEYVYFRHG
jgi:hypothetical protein